MRVTNSMLVSNFMQNLSHNLSRLDKLQNQLATNKKFNHLSDDPTAVIFSQQARLRLTRLSHYQQNVDTARNWTTQTETTTRQINDKLVSAYEAAIDASTNVKGGYDLKNVAASLEQLRDQLLADLNATYGESYLYGGYNITGYIGDNHRVVPPFTVEYVTTPDVPRYNSDGTPMIDIGNMLHDEETGEPLRDDVTGEILYDGTGQQMTWDVTSVRVFYNGFDVTGFMESYDPAAAARGEDPWTKLEGYNAAGTTDDERWEDVETMPDGTPVGSSTPAEVKAAYETQAERFHSLLSNNITLDLGTGVPMEIQQNGLDLIFYDKSDYSKNIFTLMQDLYDTVNRGAEVDDITALIPEFQSASNHVLARVATIGGKTNRLDMLESRYEQDYLNYMQMKSDAEDADEAEVIMNFKMAQAVYNAALAAGAYIIQPTLMDFLR